MTRPAVRIVLVLLLIAGVGVAAWQLYVIEKRRLAALGQQVSLDTLRDDVLRAIDDSRTAQQAYLAIGREVNLGSPNSRLRRRRGLSSGKRSSPKRSPA